MIGRVLALWVVLQGCDGDDPASVHEISSWEEAQDAWRRRDIDAYRVWMSVDPSTQDGRLATSRAAQADALYRRGLALLAQDDPAARDAFRQGLAIAPMNPALYLPLARTYRDLGIDSRSSEYYAKYLAALPEAPDAALARQELAAIDPELASVFEAHRITPPPAPTTPRFLVFGSGAAAGLLVAAAALLFVWARRGRGVSLGRLVTQSPELHPAVAYLIGSLRHELLKHRIGAVGDALALLEGGRGTPEQRAFLRARLYGGQPLLDAWKGHLRSFERALGFRLDVRKDPMFRRADRAITTIAKLENRLEEPSASSLGPLRDAHASLRDFDRELSALSGDLVRTVLTEALLRQIADEVKSEYTPGQVEVAETSFAAPSEALEVEVFRVDLVLILKNVVRNAILAMADTSTTRRLAVEVESAIEPTGEEVVHISVRDTSPQPLTTADLHDGRRVDRGLGLVTAALARYDGSIAVGKGPPPFEKSVTIRFFRALGEGGEPA